MKLSYTYAPVAGYEEFTAAFYRSADKSGPQLEEGVDTVLLVPNDAQSTYLFLEGESNDVHTGQQYKVGTCTVTIEKAQ